MNETTQDIERRLRLQEFFKNDDKGIWQDIKDELAIALHNEEIQLKKRQTDNREWSAGWVCAHEFFMDMERYFKKVWTATTLQGKTSA